MHALDPARVPPLGENWGSRTPFLGGRRLSRLVIAFSVATAVAAVALVADAAVEPFDCHGDVGTVLHAGSAQYDPAAKRYTVTGSGENMWFAKDALHFAWTKATGDL